MKGRRFWIGLFAACSIGICSGAAAAQPAAPLAGYKIDEKFTQKSPDGVITVEQYLNQETDDWKWQFWARRQDTFTLLDPEPALYPAHFIFANGPEWITREQKIGSGTSTLHLYRFTPRGYVRATRKPLDDLAWDFMKSRPDWRKLVKTPEYHESAYLLDWRELGLDWPENRYLLISLSADADVKGRKPMQTAVVNGWRCRYDLQTGKFDVPTVFSAGNAKAVRPE